MFCQNCGKEISNQADVCPHCGKLVKKDVKVKADTIFDIVGISFIVISLIFLFIIVSKITVWELIITIIFIVAALGCFVGSIILKKKELDKMK